ncbi:hypothetical protein A500_00065 [Clostridium sartagoforme AAU1]|uniref:Uncharacterized protein n=1 Tax=Clostridium sartagoforme AAU1 TaxID=1202534 RepID=R9CG56_9CLOT|nr:hypothetical protein [Clostridium sartagoforme]EOR28268.1 hypothetical protein A500_00065 [Clostridium sartagoforme AAU1]
MQYSFLGFSVVKMMELDLDMKDMAILRYFVDFKETGRMNSEIIEGDKYYWVSYKSLEEEMPYLIATSGVPSSEGPPGVVLNI